MSDTSVKTETAKLAVEHIINRLSALEPQISTIISSIPPADLVTVCGFLMGAISSQNEEVIPAFQFVANVMASMHPDHVATYLAQNPDQAEAYRDNPDAILILIPRLVTEESFLVDSLGNSLTSGNLLLQ